jgi:acyl-[acyl-carrier-protein]-phospholipid O-acyltransferase/long-chain-fatty-acid--[acyl-carrier-protein] ligase
LLPCIEHHLSPVPGIDKGGMLHVRGPNLMSGYYLFNASGQLQPPTSEAGIGWYETGDVVSIDDDGFVSVIGRVKRFAKVAGEMVSLEVVEKIATQASPGAKHGATTQPDSARGEAIVLFTTDPALTREALLASAKNLGITEIAVPGKIQRVDSLPFLGTGKTDYVTLKQLAENV